MTRCKFAAKSKLPIEFGDFETGSDDDWEPHFEAVRQKLNEELRNG